MKIAITIITITLTLVLAGALASTVNAIQIEPLPTGEGTEISDLINTIYRNALGLGGIAALVMITIGAVYFTLSGASPDKQSEGKNYIASALWGLLLLFGAFIILNTVNPQITKLAAPGEGYAQKIEEITPVGGSGSGARDICISLFEGCKAVYGRFYTNDPNDPYNVGYILKSEMRIPVFNCGLRSGACVDSINTRYVKMATGTQIQPWVLISGKNNLVQGCAVWTWSPTSGDQGTIRDVQPREFTIGLGPNKSGEELCSNAGVPE